MPVSPPVRQRWKVPQLTPTRITTALGALLLLFGLGRLITSAVDVALYVALVLVTLVVLRGVRSEPGVWLSRRTVRRLLVIAMTALCVALLATPAPTSPADSGGLLVLFVLLVLLNVALGRATQRVATAVDTLVDERQEALRNRAHHVAYVILACLAGAAVLCDVASTQSRQWLGSAFGGGGLIACAELLFVLPAMVLAFLEPARIPLESEAGAAQATQARVAAWLLVATMAIPLVLSVGILFLPEQLSASSPFPSNGAPGSATTCREFSASRTIGVLVSATVPLRAEACWDGRRATEGFGMNSSDCLLPGGLFTSVRTVSCQRVTGDDGTLSFTYSAQVSPVLLPFLHRDVTMRLRIDRHGNVEQFP